MADAFRQLDKLGSLDESVAPVPSKPAGSTARGFSAQSKAIRTPPTEPVTPEKEAQQYTDMVKELESNSNDELYSTVLADMGGRKQRSVAGETENTIPAQGSIDTATSVPPSEADTQAFMDQALAEAMKEVKINNPSMAASILDDKEIMKEIEAIFERGNDKLLQNLEEIRKEQQGLAQESAAESAQSAVDSNNDKAARLAQAESSMAAVLKRVGKETAQVEKAVEDLKSVQAKIENDPLIKLKSGGIVKQSALAGFVLFSVRSILDSIAAVGGNNEALLAPALVQAVIAMACAAYFFLV
jgi:uncharacterized protein YukE